MNTVVFETSDQIDNLRVSPDGNTIAFAQHPMPGDDQGFVASVDRRGHYRVLSPGWIGLAGLAWSPNGREVWFSGTKTSDNDRAIYAVVPGGSPRLILRAPGGLVIHDIAPDGRVLLSRVERSIQTTAQDPAGSMRPLSWTPIMLPKAASRDGRFIVLSDWAAMPYRTFLAPVDGSPATLLGNGDGTDISPDGNWVALIEADDRVLKLIPTGVGQTRTLSAAELHYQDARWSADGRSIVVKGRLGNGLLQFFRQDASTGSLQPIHVPVPDAEYVQMQDRDYLLSAASALGPPRLFSIGDGSGMDVGGLTAADYVLAGSFSDPALIVVHTGASLRTWTVEKLDVHTSRRTPVHTLAPSHDGMWLYSRRWLIPLDDGRTLVFTEQRQTSTLFLATGLR